MSAQDDGGPAFPFLELDGSGAPYNQHPGMTLRDAFAMRAMEGDWSAQDDSENGMFTNDIGDDVLESRGRLYYRMADAMLKARQK